jgi:hypothetical protein
LKYLLVAVLIVSASAVSADAFAGGRKVIFCAEGFKYGNESSDADSCKKECFVGCNLNGLLSEGWKIDTKKPREITREKWMNFLLFESGCTCTGTEYELTKGEER